MQFTMPAVGVCAILCLVVIINGQTNCNIGSACNACAEGHFKTLRVGLRDIKVCCSDCSKYVDAGFRRSDNRPYCQCIHDQIQGDCWRAEQCDQCLSGPNSSYVGRINTVPICCANCERSGLEIGSRLCNCRHNGP